MSPPRSARATGRSGSKSGASFPGEALHEQPLHGLVGQRFGEMVTLGQVAAHLPQPRQLFGGFHAFCGHLQVESVAEGYRSRDDGFIFGILSDPLDKGTIYLQGIDGQTFQVVEAGVARPEVVDSELYAQILQLLYLRDSELRVVYHDPLRYLELQAVRIQPRFLEGFHHELRLAQELSRRICRRTYRKLAKRIARQRSKGILK